MKVQGIILDAKDRQGRLYFLTLCNTVYTIVLND